VTVDELIQHLDTVALSDGRIPSGLLAAIIIVEDELWTAMGRDPSSTIEIERRCRAHADYRRVEAARTRFNRRLVTAAAAAEAAARAAACRDLAVALMAWAPRYDHTSTCPARATGNPVDCDCGF
jgi:hypothetical protein